MPQNKQECSKAVCPYCGEEFTGDTKIEAENKEGVHRTEEHIDTDGSIDTASSGKNIVDKWEKQGKRA